MNPQVLVLACAALVVFYLAGVPLVMLLYGSLRSGPAGDPAAVLTLQNYSRAYLDGDFYALFMNSLYFSLGTCVVSLVIGTYLAWLTERTNTPLRRIFMVLALIPFIIPGVLSTIAWILLLNPRNGLLNLVLMQVLGLESAPLNIYSMWGMIWAESIHLYPLVFLMMSAAMRNMDTSLEEAALTSGSSNLRTFGSITFPLMRPAMLAVLIIVFVRGIEAFEVPALVGMPARISVFTTNIFLAINQYPSDVGLASAYAVTLLLLSASGVAIYGVLTRRTERFATVTGKGYRPRVLSLGRWRYVTSGSALLIFFVAAVLPVVVLLWTSFVPYYGVPSRELIEKLTLGNYRFILTFPTFWDALRNSFGLALGSATLIMLLTSLIAWITVKSRIPGRSLLDTLTFLPIAMPGIVLGVSLLWFYLTIPVPIYGTIWILLIAYATKFMPYGIRAASATMIQINKELEEASLASGASWLQTFSRVLLPLLMPGFVAGWIYISIVALRELSTSILLYSHDSIVLSILAFDLWDGGQYAYVAALGVLMILVLVAMASVARKLGARMGVAD